MWCPQNRERVFVISIRKDIDTGKYAFPTPFDTGVRLKDILEDTVDEKYYLSDVATKKFKLFSESKGTDIKVAGSLREDRGVSNRKAEGTAVLEQVGQIYGTEREPNPQAGRVYNSECLSPTLDTCSGGNRMPKIVESGQIRPKDRNYNKHGAKWG